MVDTRKFTLENIAQSGDYAENANRPYLLKARALGGVRCNGNLDYKLIGANFITAPIYLVVVRIF